MQISPIEVQKSLKDIDYPVKKKELVQHAKKHGASKEVMEILDNLPDKEYTSPTEVSKEFHGEQGHKGHESSRGHKSSAGHESSKGHESNK